MFRHGHHIVDHLSNHQHADQGQVAAASIIQGKSLPFPNRLHNLPPQDLWSLPPRRLPSSNDPALPIPFFERAFLAAILVRNGGAERDFAVEIAGMVSIVGFVLVVGIGEQGCC